MLTHIIDVQVEWGDCDPAGRVFYPRFFEWVNPSCHDMLDSGGLNHDVLTEGYGLRGVLLKSVNMDFKQPAFLNDQLRVTSKVERIGGTSFTIRHTITRDAELIVSGEETRLWVLEDPDDRKRVYTERIPDEVRAILKSDLMVPAT
ncbi:MAG: acyl-CoA thioesterase, partial [Fimbriimonadaceae bacterium]|nr:acyl-CoA thioesterase [Alphaproteobacteria bacterium]